MKAAYTWTHVSNALDASAFVQASTVLSKQDPALKLDDFDLMKQTGQTRLERVERAVLDVLHRPEGQTVRQACVAAGVDFKGDDKNLAARVMASSIGVGENQDLLELAAAGVRVKTMHFQHPAIQEKRKTEMLAFESMSFPVVNLIQMSQQEWDDDDVEFRDQVQRLLIIPTFSADRDSDQLEREIGRAFLWSPTPEHWKLICEDWVAMRDLLNEGAVVYRQVPGKNQRENDMPGTRKDRAAHTRPKARDSTDEYLEPTGKRVTKQCLWLNGWFVRRLLLASRSDSPQEEGILV